MYFHTSDIIRIRKVLPPQKKPTTHGRKNRPGQMESCQNHNYTLLNTEVAVQYLQKGKKQERMQVQGRIEGEKQPCFEMINSIP